MNEDTFELLDVDVPEETPEVIDLNDKPKVPETKEEDSEELVEPDEAEETPVDELEELEEDLKEPTEEDLELMTPVRRREILSKYPKLFKDFPYLEKAYYREQQFTELFPTIDDAKTSVEKARVLDGFEQQIMGGSIESVLGAVKTEDQNAFYKIVDNYLPTLQKIDPQAHAHVMSNIAKNLISSMVREGRSMGENGQPLEGAAQVLHQYIFGSNKFTPPVPLAKEIPKKEDDQVAKREQEYKAQRFQDAYNDLETRANNTLKATIEANIDPKKTMTDYVRNNAIRDVTETVENLVSKDTRFRTIIDKLWEKADKENFSKASLDAIKSAYLGRCKQLLPPAIKKARNEALKGMGRRPKEDEVEEIPAQRNSTPKVRQSAANTNKGGNPSKGMRTVDFFMKD